jgi:hypothetical protein
VKTTFCGDTKQHSRHEWYWKNILRRDCPGYAEIDWGSIPLAGCCKHGVGMLDRCDDCCPPAGAE